MADAGLTGPDQGSAAHRVIGAYLAELADRLGGPPTSRAAIVAELEDGLWAATATHQAGGSPPEAAARAAVAEFGDPTAVAAGFGPELAAATGRRVGLGLLTTGPLVGTGWLLVVVASWTRSGREPPPALGLVAALAGLVASTVFTGGVAWPAGLLAAGASCARLSLAGRAARRCLASRASLT
jgi:HAAS